MKYYNIVNGPMNVSAIIQGCMRMPSLSKEDAAAVVSASARRLDFFMWFGCPCFGCLWFVFVGCLRDGAG